MNYNAALWSQTRSRTLMLARARHSSPLIPVNVAERCINISRKVRKLQNQISLLLWNISIYLRRRKSSTKDLSTIAQGFCSSYTCTRVCTCITIMTIFKIWNKIFRCSVIYDIWCIQTNVLCSNSHCVFFVAIPTLHM